MVIGAMGLLAVPVTRPGVVVPVAPVAVPVHHRSVVVAMVLAVVVSIVMAMVVPATVMLAMAVAVVAAAPVLGMVPVAVLLEDDDRLTVAVVARTGGSGLRSRATHKQKANRQKP